MAKGPERGHPGAQTPLLPFVVPTHHGFQGASPQSAGCRLAL